MIWKRRYRENKRAKGKLTKLQNIQKRLTRRKRDREQGRREKKKGGGQGIIRKGRGEGKEGLVREGKGEDER